MFWIAIAILILGLFGARILRRHLREAKLLRLREISHKERVMAMERGLPVPNADAERIDSLLGEGEGADASPDRMSSKSVHWIRLVSLALGLTFLFGGVGAVPGLYLQSNPEASGAWPVSLIPIFIGTGLLIFVRLSRGLAEVMNGEGESR
jgi:hypothetical protein